MLNIGRNEYTLCGKTFNGAKLKKVITQTQDFLIDKSQKNHNEIVGIAPEIQGVIAKEKDPNKLPEDFLNFAYENNYPIVLI